MRLLWEKKAVPDPVAHQAKRVKRWLIALGLAALAALSVIAVGAWGLVYSAIVLVIAAIAIEPMHWLRLKQPVQQIWTDGTVLGVEGACDVANHPREPVPLAAIAAFSVYPVLGGSNAGGGTAPTAYTAIDLWLPEGRRRVWLFDRTTGITLGEEAALARVLSEPLPGRWREAPTHDDMPAKVGKVDHQRLARWA